MSILSRSAPAQASDSRPPFPRAFYVSLLATVMFSLGATSLIPIVPLFITDDLNIAEHWIGTATLVVAFAAVSLRIPSGALADRYGKRLMLMIGAGIAVLASVLYTLSYGVTIFLIARVLTGASLAFFTTVGKAISADLSPASRRGEGMGMTNAAFSVAQIISPLIGEGIGNAFGFRAVFVFTGVVSLVALAIAATLPGHTATSTGYVGLRQAFRATLRERGVWAACALIMGLGAILALMYTFYPLFSERKALFDASPDLIAGIAMGLGLSVWALIDTLIEPLAGRLSDRIGRQPVALPGMVIAAIGVLALSRAHDPTSTYLAIAILATGWGAARAVADATAQDAVVPGLRAMSAAVLYTSFDFSVGINAQALSPLIDGTNFDLLFRAALVIVLVFGFGGILASTGLHTYDRRAAQLGRSSAGLD